MEKTYRTSIYIFDLATRPGILTLEQHKQLHEAFHRCVRVRTSVARDHAANFGIDPEIAEAFVGKTVEFYLDKHMRDGLNAMFARGYARSMIPRMRYQHPMFSMLGGKAAPFHELTVQQVLEDSISGKRVSVIDAVRLAREASLADLGLAADSIRSKVAADRTVKYVAVVDRRSLHQPASIEEDLEVMVDQGINHLLLIPQEVSLTDLERWENLINHLKLRLRVELEGFSIPLIIAIARSRNVPVQEIAARLITAGLSGVPSIGGGMLIQRIHEKRGAHEYTVQEWIDTAKWLHSLSAHTSCFLSLDPQDTWEERMVHLHKLRSLQDMNPGFRCFHVEIAPWFKGIFPVEEYLRALAVSRIFLDNIHTVQEPSLGSSEVTGALGLCFGANELKFQAADGHGNPTAAAVQLLRTLWEAGIDSD